MRILAELHLMGGYVTSLAWSPDGSQLAVGGMLGDVVIIDPAGEQPDHVLARNFEATGDLDRTVMDFCWSDDGQSLVASSRSSLSLFGVARGELLAHRSGVTGPVVRVPGSRDFVCIGADGDPQRIDGGTLARRSSVVLPRGGPAGLLAVSPDGERLAVATIRTCELLVFELGTGRHLQSIDHGGYAVTGLGWPDEAEAPWWLADRSLHAFGKTQRFHGRGFLAAGDGSRVAVLRADGWKILHAGGQLTQIGQDHGALALHPDGETWARAASGRLDIGRGGKVVRSIQAPVWFENLHTGQLSGDGRFVSLGGCDRVLAAFAVADGQAVSVAGIPDGWFVPFLDGPELVWSSGTELSWWQLDRSGPPKKVRGVDHALRLNPLVGLPELHGRWLTQPAMSVLDVDGELPSPAALLKGGIKFLPVVGGDTRWVKAAHEELRFLEADGETIVRTVPLPGSYRGLAVSPDGKRVAVAYHEEHAQVFDVESGEPVGRIGVLRDLSWLDGTTVIGLSTAVDGAHASIWSIDSGKRLAHIRISQNQACRLLDVSRRAKRALIEQRGVARVVAWD